MDRSERPGLLTSFNIADERAAGYDGLPDVTQQEASVMPGDYPSLTGKMLNDSKRM